MPTSETTRLARNDLFNPKLGLDREKPKWVEIIWMLFKIAFFLSPLPWPSRIKTLILRLFGAKVGCGLYLRPRVNIHFPWKLEIGDYCWIGDSCEILNLERVVLEDHVALAHEIYLAAGSHNIRSASMAYNNQPIRVKSHTWIATRAFIGPGVTIGTNCVVAACSVVIKDVPDNCIVAGNPARTIGQRMIDQD